MAQNQFVNITVDPSATKKVDNTDHKHTVSQGAAASGDATMSIDNTKITTMTILDSTFAAMRRIYAAQLPR